MIGRLFSALPLVIVFVGLSLPGIRSLGGCEVILTSDELVVKMKRLDVMWAARSSVSVPLRHVRSASVRPRREVKTRGIRKLGTALPFLATIGKFGWRGESWLWNVRRPAEVLVVDLDRESGWAGFVLEVDDPASVAGLISARLPAAEGQSGW